MSLKACLHERHVFDVKTRQIIVNNIIDILTPRVDEFDSIAVSGYSSALIGSIVAQMLGKNILLVRKKSEERQSSFRVEGFTDQRAILIDDLVDSGETLRRVYKGCHELSCRLVGLVLYNDDYDQNHPTVPMWGRFNINEIVDEEEFDGANFSDDESSCWSTGDEEDTGSIYPYEVEESSGWTTE